MHIEFLVEDSSGKALLDIILPKILGKHGEPHTWRIISYKGIGKIPRNLHSIAEAKSRILLDRLPRLLQGYGKAGVDAVVIVVDSDRRDCAAFLKELGLLLGQCDPAPRALFRLAIEEIEAWYFGDIAALKSVYPKAKQNVIQSYVQDGICGTWERLADAVFPGGYAEVKKRGWPLPGELKHEWAKKIGPKLDVENNLSPSFAKLRDGIRRLVQDS